MKSLEPKYLQSLTFSSEEASMLGALREHRGKQDLFSRQTPELLESLRQVAAIESSESSNRIEGITALRERIQALVLKSTQPKDRSEREIAGYRDALNLIHESHEHMPFSANVVLQLHALVYRYQQSVGGRWKATDNEIVERSPDGSTRVRFKCVPAVSTPGAMDGLVRRYSDELEVGFESLVLTPLVILDFLCIHPFTDGNGRAARLITLLLLYHHGFRVGRYISLERIFEESKETYYEALEASSQRWHEGKHDVHPWLNYFWGALWRAASEFEERVGAVREGRGSKTDQVRDAIYRRLNPFAISDIEADCPGVSRPMIKVVLKQLKDEGELAVQGKGRGAKWVRSIE